MIGSVVIAIISGWMAGGENRAGMLQQQKKYCLTHVLGKFTTTKFENN